MTNEEAMKWCQDHSVVAIFHRKRVVLVCPREKMDVIAFRETGFKLEMRRGFAIAMSDPGDEFHVVVEAARGSWAEGLSPMDKIAEAMGQSTHVVEVNFKQDFFGDWCNELR